jgi:hypothetical protein
MPSAKPPISSTVTKNASAKPSQNTRRFRSGFSQRRLRCHGIASDARRSDPGASSRTSRTAGDAGSGWSVSAKAVRASQSAAGYGRRDKPRLNLALAKTQVQPIDDVFGDARRAATEQRPDVARAGHFAEIGVEILRQPAARRARHLVVILAGDDQHRTSRRFDSESAPRFVEHATGFVTPAAEGESRAASSASGMARRVLAKRRALPQRTIGGAGAPAGRPQGGSGLTSTSALSLACAATESASNPPRLAPISTGGVDACAHHASTCAR